MVFQHPGSARNCCTCWAHAMYKTVTCRAAHQGEADCANYSIDHQGIPLQAGVGLAAPLRLLLLIAAGQQVAHLQRQSSRADT